MALIRGHHFFDSQFTQVPNAWLRDARLSLEARGLLAQILSHKPGWELSVASVAAQNSVGRDKVRRMMNELFEFGYLMRSDRQRDEQGRLGSYDYTTCDPDGVAQEPTPENPTQASRPPKKNNPKNTIEKNSSSKIIASTYEPSDKLRAEFAVKFPALSFDDELAAFRDHHTSKGSRFKDWDAAFRTWARNAVKWLPKGKVAASKPAEGPGRNQWKLWYHEQDDHTFCNPGEFGHK